MNEPIKTLVEHSLESGKLAPWQRILARWKAVVWAKHILRYALVATIISVIYWGLIASDRYVSEAHIIIQQTNLTGGVNMDFGSIISGFATPNRSDLLLLREYLRSVDMLNKLDQQLDLRSHFSDTRRDVFSRLFSRDLSIEFFHRYFLSRINVELDDYSGVLAVKSQAFDAETAQAMTALMVSEGEKYMNELVHHLAANQVEFLENRVREVGEKALAARQDVLAFQNRHGMVAPQGLAQSLTEIIYRLEGELSKLKTERFTLLSYMKSTAPNVVDLNNKIAAIEKQIQSEQGRLTTPKGGSLNQTVEEFQRVQLTAELLDNSYKATLLALEKVQVETTRTLKKVSVIQSPSKPEYPMEPSRLYNSLVSFMVIFLVAGLVHLTTAIIRDHRD